MARYGLHTKFEAKAGQRDALVALLEAARRMEGSAGAGCEICQNFRLSALPSGVGMKAG
jgi:hypothetical protein